MGKQCRKNASIFLIILDDIFLVGSAWSYVMLGRGSKHSSVISNKTKYDKLISSQSNHRVLGGSVLAY